MNWIGIVVVVVLLALVLGGGRGSTNLTGDPSVPYEDDPDDEASHT